MQVLSHGLGVPSVGEGGKQRELRNGHLSRLEIGLGESLLNHNFEVLRFLHTYSKVLSSGSYKEADVVKIRRKHFSECEDK